jgi:hypothetical protein
VDYERRSRQSLMQKRRQGPSVQYKGYVAFLAVVGFGGSNQRHAAGTGPPRAQQYDLSRAGRARQSSQAEGGGVRSARAQSTNLPYSSSLWLLLLPCHRLGCANEERGLANGGRPRDPTILPGGPHGRLLLHGGMIYLHERHDFSARAIGLN